LNEYFSEPIEEVWHALTDARLLAAWLMENDFEPRIGKRFVLRTPNKVMPGWPGLAECEVLELRPPTRMVWSWSSGAGDSTVVVFELRPEGDGTRLSLHHSGSASDASGIIISERWPVKLRALGTLLARYG